MEKNAKKNNQKIEVYRYMWLFDGNENLNIKVIAGLEEEHNAFIEALKKDERVINACRVYVHEIDVSKIEMYDSIKKVGDKGEESK